MLETLAITEFPAIAHYNHWRTLRCKGFSVFRSCAVVWNGVLFWGWRKSFWKSPISNGLQGQQ